VLLKLGVILAAIPMSLMAVVAGTGLVVVDVKESDGPRIVVPVPLLLVEAAARFAPDHARHVPLGHHFEAAHVDAAIAALDALAEAPDCDLVRVEDGDTQVRVSKRGDLLEVRVDGRDEDVNATVPLDLARRAVEHARGGSVSAGDLVAALRAARLTRLVDVRNGDDRVTVTVW
jgi:hypothetical protein